MIWVARCSLLVLAWSAELERRLEDGCDQGDVEAMLPYEQRLMEDFSDGKSNFGRMCFDTTQGAKDSEAQALFILGMKFFSNFAYDFCKNTFEKLIRKKPDFVLGYWGRSLCNAQLVWNYEEPLASAQLLADGRRILAQLKESTGYELSAKEQSYYSAAEALNSYASEHAECPLHGVDPSGETGLTITRPCRVLAFLHDMEQLAKAYPDDPNAGGLVVLGNIAASASKCKNVLTDCSYMDTARALAHILVFDKGIKNPALLHFGLHAHDYPDEKLYEGGFPYAEEYPNFVNGSCHSTHMPSHIWDRAGVFDRAESSNADSVRAADFFAQTGALAYDGGEFGSMDWTPGAAGWSSGLGFALDGGNIYHSLEYQQYENLQMCKFAHARRLTDRMATAAFQAFTAVGAPGEFGADISKFAQAWRDSTTFWQFFYRMEARFAQSVVMFKLLGGVGAGVPDLGTIGFKLPLPLSWAGMDIYSHKFYSPQSEAGIWAAVALDRLLQRLGSAAPPKPVSTPDDKQLWMMACSDEPVGRMVDCIDSIAGMAVRRISMVQKLYLDDDIGYESNLTSAVRAQVNSAARLVAGDLAGALKLAEESRDDEIRALRFFGSGSSSLYFIPGTAWHGIICLRLFDADASNLPKEPRQLLEDAQASFAHCISPAGRPNHTACLLGAARVEDHLWKLQGHSGRSPQAAALYDKLLKVWGTTRRVPLDPSPAETCDEAWHEALDEEFKPPLLITECGEGTTLVGSKCIAASAGVPAFLQMLGIAVVAAVVGAALGWCLRAQRSPSAIARSQSQDIEVRSFKSASNDV